VVIHGLRARRKPLEAPEQLLEPQQGADSFVERVCVRDHQIGWAVDRSMINPDRGGLAAALQAVQGSRLFSRRLARPGLSEDEVLLVQRLHLGVQSALVTAVVDHVVRRLQTLLPTGLRPYDRFDLLRREA